MTKLGNIAGTIGIFVVMFLCWCWYGFLAMRWGRKMILLCGLLLVVGAKAWGHGDAGWIMMEPAFVAPSGGHCCGPSDCERMPADVQARLRPVSGGWELDGVTFLYGEKGMYASIDSVWWWCRLPTPRCLFEPQMGS